MYNKRHHNKKIYQYSRHNISFFFFTSKSLTRIANIIAAHDRKIREFSVSNSFNTNPLSNSLSSSSSNSSSSQEASAHENEGVSDNENREVSDNESGYSSDSNRSAVSESRDDYALNHMPTQDVPEDVLPRFVSTMELVARESEGDPDIGQLHADRYQTLKTEMDSRIEAGIMPRPNVGQVNIYSENGGPETSSGGSAENKVGTETSSGGGTNNVGTSSLFSFIQVIKGKMTKQKNIVANLQKNSNKIPVTLGVIQNHTISQVG